MSDEATMEAPMETGMEEGAIEEAPAEGDITQDYIQETLDTANKRIGDSKYLEEEEGEPEQKKTAKPQIKAQAKGQADAEDEDDSKEARTNAKWDLYRTSHRENPKLKAEVADLKQKLAQSSDTRELESLRQAVQHFQQEREGLMRAIEIGNVEQSQRWNDYVTEPLNRMWEHAQVIAKRNNLDPNQLVGYLVNRDDVGLNDYMAEARPGDKHHAFGMIRDLDQIDYTKEQLRKNAHQLRESDQAQYSAYRDQHMKQIGEVRQNAVERIIPKFEERILSLLPKDKRTNLQGSVKHVLDYDNWKEDVKMYGGFAALVLPDVLDAHKALRTAYKAARDELVKLRGGGPRVNSGATTSPRRAQIENEEEEDEELKKPIREFAMGAAHRIQAAAGIRQR